MSYRIPTPPPSLEELARRQQNVVTAGQLRARGVPSRVVSEHCRRGGSWQRLLPRVYLLQSGEPSPEQRMWAALLYAAQNGREEGRREGAVITGARRCARGRRGRAGAVRGGRGRAHDAARGRR
ncbi:type IV toxin-antitoxin system AbiEi family antitoxin domain-containing protein, partial [Kitasatospora sp. NPDC001574]